ncbi:hypothetical protein AGMMS50239_09470 [Bacteroidia bacterium]|nr:hypothetical protein AGMMS50239_09470 [Bacteroidia bacterium]
MTWQTPILKAGCETGNTNDAATFERMINNLRVKTSGSAKKAIVVMDAGIATDVNLTMPTEKATIIFVWHVQR